MNRREEKGSTARERKRERERKRNLYIYRYIERDANERDIHAYI